MTEEKFDWADSVEEKLCIWKLKHGRRSGKECKKVATGESDFCEIHQRIPLVRNTCHYTDCSRNTLLDNDYCGLHNKMFPSKKYQKLQEKNFAIKQKKINNNKAICLFSLSERSIYRLFRNMEVKEILDKIPLILGEIDPFNKRRILKHFLSGEDYMIFNDRVCTRKLSEENIIKMKEGIDKFIEEESGHFPIYVNLDYFFEYVCKNFKNKELYLLDLGFRVHVLREENGKLFFKLYCPDEFGDNEFRDYIFETKEEIYLTLRYLCQ